MLFVLMADVMLGIPFIMKVKNSLHITSQPVFSMVLTLNHWSGLCHVDPEQFFKEIEELRSSGYTSSRSLVSVAKKCSCNYQGPQRRRWQRLLRLEQLSVEMDQLIVINMTRNGVRAEDLGMLRRLCCRTFMKNYILKTDVEILFEGAQGFGLDM